MKIKFNNPILAWGIVAAVLVFTVLIEAKIFG